MLMGFVNKGDFIIPSGQDDGIGIAVSLNDLTPENRIHVVGRAWESSSNEDVTLINTAVGFAFGAYALSNEMELLEDLKVSIDELKEGRRQVIDKYDDLLMAQQSEIDELLSKLEAKLEE